LKILIADDEPNILLSLEFLIRKAGYDVCIARNGYETLEIAAREKPEIVILDIMMPDIDGFEVCKILLQKPETSQTKIVFLSAKSKESDIQKGYEAGAILYITKPFSTRTLMEKIKELSTT
jgi:two-component system, OmpR family, alkaline phosphatase synthesis response regulator PhoP